MPAIVVAGAVAAAGAVGGAVIGAKAQSKSARRAAATAQQTADKNNALQRETYAKNESALAPYMERGNVAGSNLNALLGLAPANDTATAPAAESAFKSYLDSTGYKFQMDEGTDAINTNMAARGLLESGAALKSLQSYGQNTGKAFFKDYLGLLDNQQRLGLSGASALAGVSQNFANATSANNNNAGSAAANAQLISGQSTANMWSQIGGAVGQFAGGFGGNSTSFRPPTAASTSQLLSSIPIAQVPWGGSGFGR